METKQKSPEERRARKEPTQKPRRPQDPKTRPAADKAPGKRPEAAAAKTAPKTEQRPDRKRPPEQREKQAPARKRSGGEQPPAQKRPAGQEPQGKKQSAAPQLEPRPGTKAPARKPAQSRPDTRQKVQKSSKAGELRTRRQPDPADGIGGKRRAYGNSKPKKKSRAAVMTDLIRQTIRSTTAKSKAKGEADPAARRKRKAAQPTPAVIYTSPQAFNRNRLLVQLMTVTTVVIAVVMGLAVFFKVEVITVSGTEVYTPWAVREASGIEEGDNLLTFSRARAGAQIKANLPYVKDVSFGIKLPDTVNIIVVEEEVVYSIKDLNGQWWLINSEGRVIEQTNSGKAANYTQVLGVTLDTPGVQQKAVALEEPPTATDESGEAIPVTVSGAQRLDAALEILQALEDNDIVGSASSVDVSQIENITLWYGTRYQVILGDTSSLSYKISCMNDVIMQLSDYQSGILDISFRLWPDRAVYTPFSS